MKTSTFYKTCSTAFIAILAVTSCTKKLDLIPTNDITSQTVYSTAAGYKQALAKVYGAFALTGNTGGSGSPDIPTQIVKDEGNSDFFRLYWNLQELTTDEAGWTWQNDAGIQGLHEMSWSSINPIVSGLYYRSFFQITLCNDFIRQSSDENVSSHGIPATSADSIRSYRAEARFLRAYQYWVLMDMYANPPFVTENDAIGSGIPAQITRKDLFAYIESELKAIETELVAARANEYGRADQAAAWALLARMYLNAEIYTGTARYTDAITYCNKIINAGYSLHPKYRELMLGDNNLNTDEFIFTINYDGINTFNYGGTTYLINGPADANEVTGGTNWQGLRTTQNLVDLFTDPSGNTDSRAMFYTTGHNKIMNDLYTKTDGYSVTKYRNFTRSGGLPTGYFKASGGDVISSIDFPLFRLGEIYLVYAEAVLKGGTGGDAARALAYVNSLRTRAYGNVSGNVTAAQLTKDFILDERGRELYYEATRRTDLVRFGKFTTNAYLWAWKGGVKGGTSVADKYNVFPIPTTDLSSNPKLVQNTGY
jgi:hypothetical protein